MKNLTNKVKINQGLDEKLTQSNLSQEIVRILLHNDGIEYLGELIQFQEEELLEKEGKLGERSLSQIKNYINEKGFVLGTNIQYRRPDKKRLEDLSEDIKIELNEKISSSNLSIRALNCLTQLGIYYFGELISKDLGQNGCELLKNRNLGKNSLEEIKNYIEEKGYKFNMDIEYSRKGLAENQ